MPTEFERNLFTDFLNSKDTFRVYKGKRLIFSSQKVGLLPPLEYLETMSSYENDETVFDRITGNAAALLMTLISCKEVVSDLGSDMAIKTLDSANIGHRFAKTVDYIRDKSGQDMCPMEKLSLKKTPEEFHRALKERLRGSKAQAQG